MGLLLIFKKAILQIAFQSTFPWGKNGYPTWINKSTGKQILQSSKIAFEEKAIKLYG